MARVQIGAVDVHVQNHRAHLLADESIRSKKLDNMEAQYQIMGDCELSLNKTSLGNYYKCIGFHKETRYSFGCSPYPVENHMNTSAHFCLVSSRHHNYAT